MTQIKASVLMGLIEWRLIELEIGIECANMFDMYRNSDYRQAVIAEMAFLRALLHEIENPLPGAAR